MIGQRRKMQHTRGTGARTAIIACLAFCSSREHVFGFLTKATTSFGIPNQADHCTQGSLDAIQRVRKRDWILQKIGFGRRDQDDGAVADSINETTKMVPTTINITTLKQLDSLWLDEERRFTKNKKKARQRNPNDSSDSTYAATDYQAILRAANVIGDTQAIGSRDMSNYTHPVIKLIHNRRRSKEAKSTDRNNNYSKRDDGCKVALAVEGGGMRGCVSAGMVCAIHHLNLTDSLDAVYGSSAGTVVGAYLITDQLPWFGPEVYYDRLTTAGRQFIDTRRVLRALGLGLLDPRLLRDVMTRREAGKPVLNLSFLLKTTVQLTKPLDWTSFVKRQSTLPLNVVTSGLKSGKAVVLNMKNGGFSSLDELSNCMHASCLLPGIAGPVINLDKRILQGQTLGENDPKMVLGNNLDTDKYEPLADALLYEPLPYRTAIAEDGVTHCIVLRSRPDGVDVTGKGGLAERMIAKRFFERKNKLPHQYQRLTMQLHKKIYAEDIIRLNSDAYNVRDPYDTSEPHLLAIAVPPGSPEVSRLEVGRQAIFDGLRRGFARAYDCLVEDPAERGKGVDVAKQYFPDEIMDYNPLDLDTTTESAFSTYMRLSALTPKAWLASGNTFS